MTPGDWVGSVGVALLLLAFALNLAKVLPASSRTYAALNAVGAGLACWASWLIGFMPFVVLEGTWCAAALVALATASGGDGARMEAPTQSSPPSASVPPRGEDDD
ncbi:MAG: hypothetical protein AAGM22_02830 [Acidobacteriota bacterium]